MIAVHLPPWLCEPQSLRIIGTSFVLGTVLAAEAVWPRREARRGRRWMSNLGLVLVAGACLSLMPVAAVCAATWARTQLVGLFSCGRVPLALEILVTFIALDALMYAQHRSMHGPLWLWRLHRVHHSDVEFDATTALRFHPLEMVVVTLWKCAGAVLLGLPPVAVLLFEAVTGAWSLFIHSNIRLPRRLDAGLRQVVVTPDLHRVHHSVDFVEGNRNFGTIFSCWDRWFGTHNAQPQDPHRVMRIGLAAFRDAPSQSLRALLWQPLQGEPMPEAHREG